MKKVLIIAGVAGLSLATLPAFAGEGAGDPFPFRAPGVVTVTTGRADLPGANTDPYPFHAIGTLITAPMSEQSLPTNGAEGTVQTANSLPLGFEKGTAAYARVASAQKYRAAQLANRVARLAQHETDVAPYKG